MTNYPVLPTIKKHRPDLYEEALTIGDNPEQARVFLKEHNLYKGEMRSTPLSDHKRMAFLVNKEIKNS